MPRKIHAIAITAGLVCLLVYLRALSCDFVNFDDSDFVLGNSAIRRWDWNLVVWAFTRGLDLWIPLTWLSLALDYHFWGLNPLGYHLTNILLHAINTALVVLIADLLLKKVLPKSVVFSPSWIYLNMLLLAGLLFGIHPLRVESVAWVSERKDVLNGVFALSAVLFYLRYVQTKEEARENHGITRDYLISVFCFMLSLMAKPVSVVLPAMLLVVDWYPLNRLRKETLSQLLVEKTPYLALSAGVSIATVILAANQHILTSTSVLPVGQRLIVAGNALFEYCRLQFYPVGILPLHILPYPLPPSFTAKTLMVAVIFCCCIYAGRRYPFVTATWLIFLMPLLPVIGFLQNGSQAFAARYTYLPSVALSIVMATLIATAYGTFSNSYARHAVVVLSAALLTFYTAMTIRQIEQWENSGTLWSAVIDHQPLGRAFKSRGAYYLQTGKYSAAVQDFSTAIEIATYEEKKEIFNLFVGRGVALGNAGLYADAVKDFSTAIDLYPHPTYYYNRGLTLQAMGKVREAEEDFRRAGENPGPIKWFRNE